MPERDFCRPLHLPASIEILAAIGDVLAYLSRPENWTGETAAEAACAVAGMLQKYYEGCMIGMMFPHARAEIPYGCLPCDGSEYDRADYPELYDALHPSLHLPGDRFKTPDLRGLFVLGSSATHAVLSTGGAESVGLTAAQNGPHTHTTQPHSHTEVAAVATIINGGLEAPAAAATPSPATTGSKTVTVDQSGEGEGHENMPPYMAFQICIVAS